MSDLDHPVPGLEPVLTTSELAAHLGVPVQTIHDLRHSGRRGESLPMRVGVDGRLVAIKGKGVYRQEHPKTSGSRRTLEVPEFTAEVIRRRLKLIEDKGMGADHLLFFTRNDTPLSMNNVRRTLRKMLADAGLSHLEVSPHTFRRTSGTVIARAIPTPRRRPKSWATVRRSISATTSSPKRPSRTLRPRFT